MNDIRSKVLEIVRFRGPVIPTQVSKLIQKDTIYSGAILADLVQSKEIKISHGKIGGSPLYYYTGQEAKLQLLEKYLGGREKEAYQLLRQKKVINAKECEPWERVALSQLKDFAIAVKVNINDEIETFWKWYLLSNEEIKTLIEDKIKEITVKEPVKEEVIEKPIIEKVEIQKPLEIKLPEKNILEKPLEIIRPKEIAKILEKPIIQPKKETTKSKKEIKPKAFYLNVKNLFTEKDIEVLEEKTVKKEKEFEFIVNVPSEIGKLKFFVKAKLKKKINEADLREAFIAGQDKKLPVMFISDGQLTKKANDYMEKQFKGYLIFREL